MTVKLNTSSGGSISIAPTNTSSTFTLNAPARNGTLGTEGPAFGATMSAGIVATSGSQTKLPFNTEEFDTNSCYNTSLYRFQPNVAGYYQVSVQITGAGTTVNSGVSIAKNDVIFKSQLGNNATNGSYRPHISCLIYLNGTTDYIEAFGFQNVGVSGTLGGAGAENFFTACLMRGA